MELHRSTLPLYPTDEGWPYPDVDAADLAITNGFVIDDDVDLDALELIADRHAFDTLTDRERSLLELRYRDGVTVGDLARWFSCTRADVVEQLATAVTKLRRRLVAD